MSSLQKLQTCRADVQLCAQDLKNIPDEKVIAKDQLLNNILPLLSSILEAQLEAFEDLSADIADIGSGLDELIEHTDDFLLPETSDQLTSTIQLGLAICVILTESKVTLPDDLANRRLQDAIRLYQQQAILMLEKVEEVTLEDDEGDDDDDDNPTGPVPTEGSSQDGIARGNSVFVGTGGVDGAIFGVDGGDGDGGGFVDDGDDGDDGTRINGISDIADDGAPDIADDIAVPVEITDDTTGLEGAE